MVYSRSYLIYFYQNSDTPLNGEMEWWPDLAPYTGPNRAHIEKPTVDDSQLYSQGPILLQKPVNQ